MIELSVYQPSYFKTQYLIYAPILLRYSNNHIHGRFSVAKNGNVDVLL